MSNLQLPKLLVEAKAEMLSNNLPEFEAAFRESVDNMKYQLINESDFAKAKDDIKALKSAENGLKAVDDAIVNGSIEVKEIRERLAKLASEARDLRLSREKEIKIRDAEIKAKIIEEALDLIDHPKREQFRQDVIAGAKGKRSFEAMAKGANAAAKAINEPILETREILAQFAENHGRMLIPDAVDLELKLTESVTNELNHRLEKQRDEEEKKRLKAEADKAKAEAASAIEKSKAETKEPESKGVRPAHPDTMAHLDKRQKERGEQAETPEQEMGRFMAIAQSSFAPVKEARMALKHADNIKTAASFADQMAAAWITFKKEVSK